MNRRPPHWPPHTDKLAAGCGIRTISFSSPMPAGLGCHYCAAEATTRDHVVPDSVGGARLWWNLVPACEPCNLAKADRQSCTCLFCLRAMALWSLGHRREGKSYREKRTKYPATAPPTSSGLSPEQLEALSNIRLA
jgi:hypothetical protein